MNIFRMIEKERKNDLRKIFIPLVLMAAFGYFLRALIIDGFFKGWEVYFAVICFASILFALLIIDAGIIGRIYYNIYVEEGRVKIRDGLFSRPVSIPLDRLYYISSVKLNGKLCYESILFTDKKVNHRKVKFINMEEFIEPCEHREAILELMDNYPERTFYYYRVIHKGYKFLDYLYMAF